MTSDSTLRPPRKRVTHNRVRAFLLHTKWYSIQGQTRLSKDTGFSRGALGHLIHNEFSPSYYLARAITDAISARMGVPLDIRELFTTDGTYPTARVCDLTAECHGCFPPEAYTKDGFLTPEYRDLKPGDWCTSRPSNIQTTVNHSS